jgi:hypothetical protein
MASDAEFISGIDIIIRRALILALHGYRIVVGEIGRTASDSIVEGPPDKEVILCRTGSVVVSYETDSCQIEVDVDSSGQAISIHVLILCKSGGNVVGCIADNVEDGDVFVD